MISSRHVFALASLLPLGLAVGNGCASPDESGTDETIGSSVSAASRRSPPSLPAPTTIVGILNSIPVGRLKSTGLGGGTRYFVQSPDRKVNAVEISASVIARGGGAKKLLGKSVTLSATLSSSGGALIVDSVKANSMSGDEPDRPVQQLGTKRWLTVLCRFEELSGPDSHTQDYFRGLMGSAPPGVGDYWSKASRGQLTIDGSTVLNWQNMPFKFSYYQGLEAGDKIGFLINDCMNTAAASSDLQSFDGIALAFSHNLEQQVIGAQFRPVGGGGKWLGLGVLSPNEFTNQSSVNRILGLGLGLTTSGSAPEHFDSPWDVMSQGYGTTNGVSCRLPTLSFGCASVLPAAEHAVQTGWTGKTQVGSVAATEAATFDLDFVGATPLPGHVSVVHMPIDATHYYTVEARAQATETYDARVPNTGLVIHSVNLKSDDIQSEGEAREETMRLRLVAALPDGSATYTDRARQFRVDFVRKSFGYTVAITRGYSLTVTALGGTARVTGSGVSCNVGQNPCYVGIPMGTTIELEATPHDGFFFSRWVGCSSVTDRRCTVTLDQAKTVTLNLSSRPDPDSDPEECVCLPTWPRYKCEQICGDRG